MNAKASSCSMQQLVLLGASTCQRHHPGSTWLSLVFFLPCRQRSLVAFGGPVLNMLSNMSPSDLSSPLHITMSGEFPFSTIRCMTFSTARAFAYSLHQQEEEIKSHKS